MPVMPLFGSLLGRNKRQGAKRLAAARRFRTGNYESGLCPPCDDVEAPSAPPRQHQLEVLHSMRRDDTSGAATPEPMMRKKKSAIGARYNKRDPEEVAVWKIVEQRQRTLNREDRVARLKSIKYAKEQILEAESTVDLVNRAENLIEEDWLGTIDAMPGNMFSIGAFGSLFSKITTCNVKGVKAQARLFGCAIVATIQLVGPPAVFLSITLGWGVKNDEGYKFNELKWDNMLTDWERIKLTKFIGLLFLLCFILNGLFVILEEKQTWFKIYSTFQYLQRNTPKFEVTGSSFLYFGAFVNCWTVLWCCISSFVVVGQSPSPRNLLQDALGMLFLYNLDDIGGDLGLVDADDWPGLRLAWIYEEMVKTDWKPNDAEEMLAEEADKADDGPQYCMMQCGRLARGWDPEKKKNFTTCCRACGIEGGRKHDPSCKRVATEAEDAMGDGQDEQDLTKYYTCGGWSVLLWFYATTSILALLAVVCPILATFTPFTLIVPNWGK